MEMMIAGKAHTPDTMRKAGYKFTRTTRLNAIDGDILCYAIASRCEVVKWGVVRSYDDVEIAVFRYKSEAVAKWKENPEEWRIHKYRTTASLKEVLAMIRHYIDHELMPELPPKAYNFFCVTHGTTFRHALFNEYKKHRKEEDVPYWLPYIRGAVVELCKNDFLSIAQAADDITKTLAHYINEMFFVKGITPVWMPFAEADDVMSILVRLVEPDNATIISTDKDMLQCGVDVRDLTNRMTYRFSANEANRFLAQQILMGDPVDGIKGLPGIGKIKSLKLLEEAEQANPEVYDTWGSTWEALQDMYRKVYSEEEYMQQLLLNYRLVKLLETVDEIKNFDIKNSTQETGAEQEGEGC